MSTASAPFVKAVEAVAQPTAQTAKAWLQASPSGAYTTARTCRGKVFEWSAHVQRTADSIGQMAPVGGLCEGTPMTSATLRAIIRPAPTPNKAFIAL